MIALCVCVCVSVLMRGGWGCGGGLKGSGATETAATRRHRERESGACSTANERQLRPWRPRRPAGSEGELLTLDELSRSLRCVCVSYYCGWKNQNRQAEPPPPWPRPRSAGMQRPETHRGGPSSFFLLLLPKEHHKSHEGRRGPRIFLLFARQKEKKGDRHVGVAARGCLDESTLDIE